MSEETVKFKDVPKGKRFRQFMDYYKTPFIVGILVVIALISLVKTVFFPHVPEVEVLAATASVYLSEDQITLIQDALVQDGFEDVYVENSYVPSDENAENSQYMQAANSKLIALLASPTIYIYLVDEGMYQHMKAQNILGTYEDLGDVGNTEEVKIPLRNIPAFAEADGLPDDLYLCIRAKDTAQLKSEKKTERYEDQMNVVNQLLVP